MELGKIMLDQRLVNSERELSDYEGALLTSVYREIGRIYWNHYQEEFSSYLHSEDKDNIFGKHGIKWEGYDWGEEPSDASNLVINNTNFWVYKYFGRSMTTDKPEKLDEDWFNKCIKILSKIEDENRH
jgi:hypothetical protein